MEPLDQHLCTKRMYASVDNFDVSESDLVELKCNMSLT
jgi:hypothetical protein